MVSSLHHVTSGLVNGHSVGWVDRWVDGRADWWNGEVGGSMDGRWGGQIEE